MYDTLKRIYLNTHDESYLEKAVKEGWITKTQKEKILKTK